MSKNTNTDILLAGAIAAFTVDLLVYPLDTIKTRIQSPDYKRIYLDASTQTVKKRVLFRGLYQGLGSVILATLPSSGAFFTTYEATRSFLRRYAGARRDGTTTTTTMTTTPAIILPEPMINATASSLGELVSCLILTPAEVLKQNAQMINTSTNTASSSSSSTTATTTTRQPSPSLLTHLRTSPSIRALHQFHHPTQLWRGYTALVARNLPFTALQFPLFEHLKSVLIPHHPQSSSSPVRTATLTALSGGLAGSIAAIVTTPIDVIKTRIMLSATAGNSRTAWATGKTILRDEGMRTLFRGGLLRAVWTALASGLYLGAYETGRRFFEGRRGRDGEGGVV